MRISTSLLFQIGTNGILDQQAQISKTQTQMSTGKKIVTPSDDPAASAHILQLQHNIDVSSTYQKNIDAATESLSNEENALSNSMDMLQRVRELAVQANSSSLSGADRKAIAQELQQHIDGLLGLANSRDGNGNFLFSGFSTETKPFSHTTTGFAYSGDQGQRYLQVGADRQVAVGDSGYNVYQSVKNGNGTFYTDYNNANTGTGIIDTGVVTDPAAWVPDTYTLSFTSPTTYQVVDSSSTVVTAGTYTSGNSISFNGVQVNITGAPATGDSFTVAPSTNQNVFTTIQNLVDSINGATGSALPASVSSDINHALQNIDQAMQKFTDVRTSVGARLNSLDSQKSANADLVNASQVALSSAQDLDYAEAASRLNQQLLGLQAAQQTFVRLQNLSLFNFL